MHRVTEQELDALASVKTGLGLTFLGFSLGAVIAFWIVLKTVPNLAPADLATFRSLAFVSTVLTVFFLVWSALEGIGAWKLVRRIKQRTPIYAQDQRAGA